MPGYFMQDTPLAGLERTMRLPPNYRPRGHGTIVIRHQYTAADIESRKKETLPVSRRLHLF